MEPVRLPVFDYPFPHAISPHAANVAEATTTWAIRHGLLVEAAAKERSKEKYGWLAARAHPNASFEALRIVADFMSWLFFEDDHNDKTDAGRMLARMVEDHRRFISILDGADPTPDDTPLGRALLDLKVRLEQHGSKTWFHEFRRDVSAYFEAIQWECSNRARQTPPGLDEYLAMRPFTSAVFPCFDLFGIADELCLPIPVHDHPTTQELRFRANNVVSYCNDIFSFEKERKDRDVHNLVILLGIEHGCSLQEAVDYAGEMHNRELASFLSLQARLPLLGHSSTPELIRYANCLGSWIWANLDWSRSSSRYQRPSD